MKEGSRKAKAFYVTLGAVLGSTVFAVFAGISFTGTDIITMNAMMSTLAGVFFGANFGEHWAQSRRVENGK